MILLLNSEHYRFLLLICFLLISFTIILMMHLAEEQAGLFCFYLHGSFDIIPCCGNCHSKYAGLICSDVYMFIMFIIFIFGLYAIIVSVIGIWTSIPALSTEETWIHHVVVQNPGVVAFLLMDIIVLLAATILTTSQASQVIY